MDSEKEVGMEELENNEPESTEQPESTPAAEPTETETAEPTEEELAAAALEETAEPEPKADPKDAVIGGMRRNLREAERRADRAEAQLEVKATPPVPEKEPLELAAEKQAVPIDEVVIDGKLFRQQQAWEKKKADVATQQQRVETFNTAAAKAKRTMTDEVHGEGLGLVALGELGNHLIDDLDQARIFRAGNDCGKEARKVLQLRILEAGGEDAKELKSRMKAHKDSQAKPKEKPGKPEPKAEVPNAEDEAGSDAFLESIFEGL